MMRAPVLATGRAFSSQRARAVSKKWKAAPARAHASIKISARIQSTVCWGVPPSKRSEALAACEKSRDSPLVGEEVARS